MRYMALALLLIPSVAMAGFGLETPWEIWSTQYPEEIVRWVMGWW